MPISNNNITSGISRKCNFVVFIRFKEIVNFVKERYEQYNAYRKAGLQNCQLKDLFTMNKVHSNFV